MSRSLYTALALALGVVDLPRGEYSGGRGSPQRALRSHGKPGIHLEPRNDQAHAVDRGADHAAPLLFREDRELISLRAQLCTACARPPERVCHTLARQARPRGHRARTLLARGGPRGGRGALGGAHQCRRHDLFRSRRHQHGRWPRGDSLLHGRARSLPRIRPHRAHRQIEPSPKAGARAHFGHSAGSGTRRYSGRDGRPRAAL